MRIYSLRCEWKKKETLSDRLASDADRGGARRPAAAAHAGGAACPPPPRGLGERPAQRPLSKSKKSINFGGSRERRHTPRRNRQHKANALLLCTTTDCTTTAPTPPRIHRAGSRAARRYVSSPTGGGPRSTIRDSLPLNPPSEAGFSSISNASRSLSRAKQNVRQRATGG